VYVQPELANLQNESEIELTRRTSIMSTKSTVSTKSITKLANGGGAMTRMNGNDERASTPTGDGDGASTPGKRVQHVVTVVFTHVVLYSNCLCV
jgi:hypothetical protein